MSEETMTEDEKNMEELRAAHKQRAMFLMQNCEFTEFQISDHATQACRTIELLFEEVTAELGMIIPNDWRAAKTLECLESACMWAKKSIAVHDKQIAKQQDKMNGHDS